MAESLTIHFEAREDGGQDVGIQYHAETSEAALHDEMLAREVALHALAAQAILHRQQQGYPIPQVLTDVVQAHTFRELF